MSESTQIPNLSTPKSLKMPRVNEVRLTGRLTHDPEVRSVMGDKMLVHLSVAVNPPQQDGSARAKGVTYVPVTVWNRLAAHCSRRLSKGNAVYVEGRLRSDHWETKAGITRSAIRVEASKMQFISKAKAGQSQIPANGNT